MVKMAIAGVLALAVVGCGGVGPGGAPGEVQDAPPAPEPAAEAGQPEAAPRVVQDAGIDSPPEAAPAPQDDASPTDPGDASDAGPCPDGGGTSCLTEGTPVCKLGGDVCSDDAGYPCCPGYECALNVCRPVADGG
jgi:hypothetical protein